MKAVGRNAVFGKRLGAVAGLFFGLTSLFAAPVAQGVTLDESCIVSILNRTIQVQPDGTWVMPNVPANVGQVRARSTCVKDGFTVSGQSDYFSIAPNQRTRVGEIVFGEIEPIPASLRVGPTSVIFLEGLGASETLSVTAVYSDGTTKVLDAVADGVNFTSTNGAIVTVDAAGKLTAVASGAALITTRKDGAVAVNPVQVITSGDSDGDGLPDDYEQANGLNSNDPIDAHEDQDVDGLTALQEYNAATDPNNADSDGDTLLDGEELVAGEDGHVTNPIAFDSDGDGLSDGLEFRVGSDPNDATSYNLAAALLGLRVVPRNPVIVFNTVFTEASRQLTVTGELIDGSTIDLTSRSRGTGYSTSDVSVVSFGLDDGRVFAGASGTAVITVVNNGFSAATAVTVETFDPVALSSVSIPGYANNVEVTGGYAFIAAGASGLQVVDVSNPTSPRVAASLDTPGTAIDLRIEGNLAYVADGGSGLRVIDISTPTAPAFVGWFDTAGSAQDIHLQEGYAYIADGANGLVIVDITDPASPAVAGTLAGMGTTRGVAVSGDRAVVVGDSGVFVVDVADRAAPAQVGRLSLNYSKDVTISGDYAYVAAFSSGWRVIDISDPASPRFTGGTNQFVPRDVEVVDGLAFYAEQLFPNVIAYVNAEDPQSPRFQGTIDLSRLGDYAGTGIAVNQQYVYVTEKRYYVGEDYGSSGDTRLFIAQYRHLEDHGTVPPTVAIDAPIDGDVYIEGETFTVSAQATDDVHVAAVHFQVNGEFVHTDTSAPYQFSYTAPVGAIGLTFGAVAVDLASNEGIAQEVAVGVIPDPGTTVVGKVVDVGGFGIGGAEVTCAGVVATTAMDGSFLIEAAPTLTDVRCEASATDAEGKLLSGFSQAYVPVRSGTTDVGSITASAGRFETELGTNLGLGDDDVRYIAFTDGFTFPFYGQERTGVYISSNGRITFNFADSSYSESIYEFNQQPQVAGFFDDLDPNCGGGPNRGVYVIQHPDRMVVTWNELPRYYCNTPGSLNTAQVVLYRDGRVQIGYKGVTEQDAIIGVSPGQSATPTESDFSAQTPFAVAEPVAVYEHFTGSADPFDLQNQLLQFTPNATGGFNVSIMPVQ